MSRSRPRRGERSSTTANCRTSSRCSAWRSSGAEDRKIVERARRLQRFLTQPFAVTEAFTGVPGRSVKVADTVAGCKAILAGECDDWRESSLYMVGSLEEAREKEDAARYAERRPAEAGA